MCKFYFSKYFTKYSLRLSVNWALILLSRKQNYLNKLFVAHSFGRLSLGPHKLMCVHMRGCTSRDLKRLRVASFFGAMTLQRLLNPFTFMVDIFPLDAGSKVILSPLLILVSDKSAFPSTTCASSSIADDDGDGKGDLQYVSSQRLRDATRGASRFLRRFADPRNPSVFGCVSSDSSFCACAYSVPRSITPTPAPPYSLLPPHGAAARA